MENINKLTPGDFEDIGMLMNISYSLLDNLYKLREMELKGEKNTKEFKNLVASYNSGLVLEDSIFKRFGDEQEKLLALLSYFTDVKAAYNLEIDIDVAMSKNIEDLVKRRITLRLVTKLNSIQKEQESGFDGLSARGLISVSETAKVDFINTVLTILNLYLCDHKYLNINKELTGLKYNLAFLHKFVEDDFLANEFSINPTLYWVVNFVSEANKIDLKAARIAQLSYAIPLIDKNLEIILNQNTYTLRDNDNYTKAIVAQILLRTCFLFSDDEVISKLKERFQTFIGINEMLGQTVSAEKMLLETINMLPADKELPQIVNLGRDL